MQIDIRDFSFVTTDWDVAGTPAPKLQTLARRVGIERAKATRARRRHVASGRCDTVGCNNPAWSYRPDGKFCLGCRIK